MKNIDHLIGNDGNLKPGALLSQSEYLQACQRGLKSASGQSLKLIEPTPDPMSARILRKSAPEDLQAALEQATTRLKESQEIVHRLFDAWIKSKRDRREFEASYSGTELLAAGVERSKQLDHAVSEAEKNLSDGEDVATACRVELMDVEQRLGSWIKTRRSEIESGTAEQIAVENAGEDRSIGARLKRLKDKIAG